MGTSEWQQLHVELQQRMGRNLMLFQAIEGALKMLLPYIHPDGSKKSGVDSLRSFRGALKGQTLGQLIGAYKQSVDITGEGLTDNECQDTFERQLKKLLDSRNTLVHGFFRQPGISTLTKEEMQNALRFLDDQYRQAQSFYRDIAPSLCFLTKALLESSNAQNEDLRQLHDLLARHIASYTTINVHTAPLTGQIPTLSSYSSSPNVK